MTYYKVLSDGLTSRNGGTYQWVLGEWAPEIEGELIPCHNGYHVCEEGDLLEWLGPVICECEIGPESVRARDKTVARAARITRVLDTWNDRTARLFACDCAERVLPLFDSRRPDDSRPRAAIEIARSFTNGKATEDELTAARAAAWYVAWDAEGSVVAWSAAGAAAGAAAAWSAVRAASWAAGDAARDAARAAVRAAVVGCGGCGVGCGVGCGATVASAAAHGISERGGAVRELKPGEYMGEDGLVHRAHLHHSVEHGDGRWWPAQSRVLPSSPDFPAAIEALQALVPEPFEWRPANGGCLRRYHNGRVEWRSGEGSWMRPSAEDGESSAFEAGRRYERERGQ